MDDEDNPALGYRAIRICLTRPQVFKTQLRALFRAAVYGNLAVMYPMITSLWEIRRIKEIVEEVKAELEDGLPDTGTGYHDRNARSGHGKRGPGRRGGLFQHRHQ